jgi:hypothetical protein
MSLSINNALLHTIYSIFKQEYEGDGVREPLRRTEAAPIAPNGDARRSDAAGGDGLIAAKNRRTDTIPIQIHLSAAK